MGILFKQKSDPSMKPLKQVSKPTQIATSKMTKNF